MTRLERDAAARNAREGARDAMEAALAEARAAAESATKDRDVLAANWRREWEAAKEDHAAELRSVRARASPRSRRTPRRRGNASTPSVTRHARSRGSSRSRASASARPGGTRTGRRRACG